MMTTNLFVIVNVNQLRTGGSFRILLPFFRTSWGVGVLNSAIFNGFQIGLSLARFWKSFGISEGGFESPKPPPRYATAFCVRHTWISLVVFIEYWHVLCTLFYTRTVCCIHPVFLGLDPP